MQDTDDENVKLLKYESKTYYYDKSKRTNGNGMTIGEIGASCGHLDIYKSFLQDENYDNCIIFEDDFQLLVNIPTFLDYLKNLPERFDICHICLSDWFPFNKTEKINKYFYKISYNSNFNRATAYIVSKSGAKKLLEYANDFVNIPPDDLLCGIYLYSEFNCEFFVPDQYLFKEIDGTISNVFSINS
jgi:GR25 family glycosyltransferase involved in LPS biosynthesis